MPSHSDINFTDFKRPYRGSYKTVYFHGANHPRRENTVTMCTALLGLAMCLVAIACLRKHMRQLVPGSVCPRSADISVASRDDLMRFIESDHEVTVMYHAPWCPHCADAKPQFESAAAENPQQKMLTCNADPAGPTLTHADLKNLQIEGFPSVIKYGPGNRYSKVYFGPRDKESYSQFAQN